MAASIEAVGARADASGGRLNFDVIKLRAADMLDMPVEDVNDYTLGGLFGLRSTTVWRWRKNKTRPAFQTVTDVASKLSLTVDQITAPKAGE